MKDFKTYIENRFKNILDKDTYKRYCTMAGVLDLGEEQAYVWNANEAYNFMRTHGNITVGLDMPTIEDWKNFLNNKVVAKELRNLVIQSKEITFRKIIANIDENKSISQGEIKAIQMLSEFINLNEKQENEVKYVQYLAPIRYSDNNEIEIIEGLLDNDK